MGLTMWAAAPEGKIVKSDVSTAKNYLTEQEICLSGFGRRSSRAAYSYDDGRLVEVVGLIFDGG